MAFNSREDTVTVSPSYTDKDAKLLFLSRSAVPASIAPLPLPFCVPQIKSGFASPFSRAYSPRLATHAIEQSDWLQFTDGLNIAFAASPPLRVVYSVGRVLRFAPYHWALVPSVSQQNGSHVVQKGLTNRYLRIANETYFAPRGLRVRICKTAALRQLVGLDPTTAHTPSKPPNKAKSAAKAVGKTLKTIAVHLPITSLIIKALSSGTDPKRGRDALSRRLEELSGHIMPLSFDVPQPAKPINGNAEQMQDLDVRIDRGKSSLAQAQSRRTRESIAQRRAARHTGSGPPSSSGYPRSTSNTAIKASENQQAAIVWIIVINMDQDKRLTGIDIADSRTDEEEIDEAEWEEQLNLEDDEEARKEFSS